MQYNPHGVQNLIRGIVKRAVSDYLNSPPDSMMHQETQRFFRSQYFEALSGLDSDQVLLDLQARYDKKWAKYRRRMQRENPCHADDGK